MIPNEREFMNPLILIAEDVLVNRLLVKSYISLEFPAAKIIEAANGIEAVNQTIIHNPEIIFMDLHMPVKNGYQAAVEIRELEKTRKINKPVVIIALSADVTNGVPEKCKQSGMNDYLQKPFKTHDIRNVLKKYFNASFQGTNPDGINFDNLPHEFVKNDLLDRLNGNVALFQKLADVAISQLTSDLAALKESIMRKDPAAIKMANHSIKGVSLNLYFSRLAELTKKMEYDYDVNVEKLLGLTEKMTQEFEIIKAELTRYE
jgi:CheY-like chemotaxis protein/HPt (histidine-containing phosphotransfer) domain-containing protein